MTERRKLRPFTGDSEKRVRLQNPPVKLVLCQLAWPDLVSLPDEMDDVARQFGRAIADYPIYEEHTQNNIVISPTGQSDGTLETLYKWKSVDNEWHVVLGRRFLSFYRTAYTSFSDFQGRLEKILIELKSILHVTALERIGLRHVNQVTDSSLVENLSDYIEREFLGFAGTTFDSGMAQIESSQNQVIISVNDALLQVRTGVLPPMQTVDPAIPLCSKRSWVLDLDSTIASQRPFEVNEVLENTGELADINYDFFKFVATDGFLRKFGSEEE